MIEKPEHSTRGASSMYRWKNCPGSVKRCRGLPDIKSVYAQEGTDAHELAARSLKTGKALSHWLGQTIGETKITEGIIRDLAVYTSEVLTSWPLEIRKIAPLFVEEKFDLDWFMPGFDLYGTNDASFGVPFQHLSIFDLKFGAGVYVDVFENDQCLYYALGALGLCDYETIKIVIVQPRFACVDGPVRSWEIPSKYVFDWAENVLKPAVLRTEEKNPRIEPGKHCLFCKAKSHLKCPEFAEYAMNEQRQSMKNDFDEIILADSHPIAKPEDLTNDQLVEIISKLDLAISFQKDCLRIAYQRAMSGSKLRGYKLVNSISHRAWVSDQIVMKRLKDSGYDLKNFIKMNVLSPSQVYQVFKDSDKINDYDLLLGDLVLKPDKGLDLVPETDRRKAVDSPSLDQFTTFDIKKD